MESNQLEIFKEFAELIKTDERVLDIGCGKGRFFKCLLSKGVKVDGIDIIDPKIPHNNFTYINQNIKENPSINSTYNAVILSCILHFFTNEKAKEIIQNAKNALINRGYHCLLCFSDKDQLRREGFFYPTINELKEIYKDCKIVKEVSGDTPEEEHDGLGLHKHNMIIMVLKV